MRAQYRRGFIPCLLAITMLAGAVGRGDQLYAASGTGPYYATPSWDQKLPASTRFVVLTDWESKVVLDRITGLVWERSPDPSPMTWDDARRNCLNKSFGGQKGWRLPAIVELSSLIDLSVAVPEPALPVGHPFINVTSTLSYWSATTQADSSIGGWTVIFDAGQGGAVLTSSKTRKLQVWCVRGGMNAEAY